MKMDDVKFLYVKYSLYSGGQPGRDSNPGNGTTGRNRPGCTYRYEPVAKAGRGFRGRGNHLNLMTHPGKVMLQRRDMIGDTTGEDKVIG